MNEFGGSTRYIFFLHWSLHVPKEIYSNYECICFHMTDVPYGRGGTPLQNLILRGHSQTKLSALKMVDEMDAGPVYAKRPLSLEGRAEDIYKRAAEISLAVCQWMIENEPAPVPQSGEIVTFKRRKPDESRLNETMSFDEIYNAIRMVDAPGYPNAYISFGDMLLKFTDAQWTEGKLEARVMFEAKDDKN